MSRDHETLRATLARLHDQLGETEDLDGEARALLRSALDDIEAALDHEPGEGDDPSLSERLSEATQHFEESHPTLAEAVARVVDTLANLGI